MADGFTVDYNLLTDQAAKLMSLKEEFDSARTQLKQAATSMGAGYESADNVRFVGQVEQICKDLENLSQTLEYGSQMLKNDAVEYQNKEAELTGKAGSLPA